MKICILSKDRAYTIKTHLFFNPCDVLIFVEPSELQKYSRQWPDYTFIDIKENNKGYSFVLNFILDYMKDETYVIADDDINYFGTRQSTGRYSKYADIQKMLEYLQSEIPTDIAICSTVDLLDPFVFFKNRRLGSQQMIVNRKTASVFCLIRGNLIRQLGVRYDTTFMEGADIDFSLQIVQKNGKIAVDYSYGVLSDVRVAGGCSVFREQVGLTYSRNVHEIANNLIAKYSSNAVSISANNSLLVHVDKIVHYVNNMV